MGVYLNILLRRLLDTEIWVVLLLSGLSLVWSPIAWGVLLVGVCTWSVRWLSSGRLTRRTPADWGILALAVIGALNLLITPDQSAALRQLLRLLNGVVLYYALVNWADSPGKVGKIAWGLLFVGAGLAAFALISVEWAVAKFPFLPVDLYERLTILVPDSANPNVMAGSMILFMPVAAAIPLFSISLRPKNHVNWAITAAAILALAWMSIVLGLTLSRGALLGFAAALLVLILLRWRRGWVVFLLLGVALWVVIETTEIRSLLDIILTSRSLLSMEERIDVWSRAVMMIRDFAFTGVGMGSFGLVADAVYPFALSSPGRIIHAHNLFLQIAVDTGLPGLIAWSSILIGMFASSWRVYSEAKKRGERLIAGIAAGLLCSQLALSVHGLVDAVTWGDIRSATLVWLIWGSLAACAAVCERGGRS